MKTTAKIMMYGKVEDSIGHKIVRGRFVWDHEQQKMVPESEYRRPQVDAPTVIPDEMEPVVSQVDDRGQVFTSRSTYYQHLKDHGYAVKEKGMFPDAKPYKADPKELKDTVERAFYDIKYDKIPFTEQEKTRWKQEQERMRK